MRRYTIVVSVVLCPSDSDITGKETLFSSRRLAKLWRMEWDPYLRSPIAMPEPSMICLTALETAAPVIGLYGARADKNT